MFQVLMILSMLFVITASRDSCMLTNYNFLRRQKRVQLGMPLKEGEKLQSLGGDWPAWIGTLVKAYVEKDGKLDDLLDWETSRGAAFQQLSLAVRSFTLFLHGFVLIRRLIQICNISNVSIASRK